MKRIFALMLTLAVLLAAGASAEGYTQADLDWADAVEDQAALTLKEQAKYLDIQKQRQGGIALLALGEPDTPFQIATGAQLAEMAQYVNRGDAAFVSAHYVMTDDVNLSAYSNWTPIGTEDQPFMGVFDGQNHVVTGLKIDRAGEGTQGLFGYVSGTDDEHKAQLKNIVVQDAQIRARYDVGAVVGRYGKFTAGYVEPLENCAMVGGEIQGTSDSSGQSSCVGGVVGRAFGEIQRCYATGNIIGANNAREYGGIVGESFKTVNACYWTGNLSGMGSYANDFGGIAGTSRGAVTNCYTTGDITGSLNDAGVFGGVVGCALDEVTNCYAAGGVKGRYSIGGIVGQTYGDSYMQATVSGCMALNTSVESSLSSIGRVTGLLGETGTLSGNYAWDGMLVNGSRATTGNQDNLNGTDLTYNDQNGLSQQLETIFGGNDAWTYTENGLPMLKNVGGPQSSELPEHVKLNLSIAYINSKADLEKLAREVNGGDSKSGVIYRLTADIDLSGQEWTSIGQHENSLIGGNSKPFSGIFDGQGYSIIGLKISGDKNYAGLFGYTYCAAIRNVVIRNPEIDASYFVGALVGCQGYSSTGIENCAVIGGKIQGEGRVGGLVGYMEESPLQNCYSTCEVIAASSDAGGIVGSHFVGASIRNCYATGNVNGEHSGGLAGETQSIERCVALGQNVTGTDSGRVIYQSDGNVNVYAWSDMELNGSKVTDGKADNKNGEDLTYDGSALSKQFSEIFANDPAWTYTENGLPILKVVKGAQSSDLPAWVKAGSAANVVHVSTMADLANLASAVNGGDNMSGKTFLLVNDIDLSGLDWVPIGRFVGANSSSNKPFSGVFDGQGHSIIGLTISGNKNYAGLFGYTHLSTIRNVVIRNPQIDANSVVGALVGYQAYSSTGIENCAVIGGKIQGTDVIGGLVGRMEESPLRNCYSTCEVIATESYAGGIVGTHLVGASIRNCYATGNISGKYSGGVAGLAQGLEQCVALGQNVTGNFSGRVMYDSKGSANNLYAWSDMQLNKIKVTDGKANNKNGENLTYDKGVLSKQFSEIFANDPAWTYTENGLPILKVVKGTQSSDLPAWMKAGAANVEYIYTAEDLANLAQKVNGGDNMSGKTVLLMNDIDLSGLNWVPIGRYVKQNNSNNKPFSGVFDGQGHSIIGLTISGGQNDAGLFGYTYLATIRNVVIRNPQIEGRDEVGALVGYQAYSSTGIEKCAVIGGKIQGTDSVGGLVGYMEESPLQNCYSTCEVIATEYYAGGIVGRHAVGASIRSCYATGNISGKYSGGIVGLTQGIEQCVALGQTVTGDGSSRVIYRSDGSVNVYAWSGMKVNNQTVTDGQADNENGEDILAHNGLLYGKDGQIFAWPGFDTSIWELRNDQPGKLPRFKGTSADPTLNLTAQGSTVTYTVTLNGGTGVLGYRYKLNNAAKDTDYTTPFEVGLTDALEITPILAPGYEFEQWSDGRTNNPYTATVTGAITLTAQARVLTYNIDYALNGGALEEGQANPTTYTVETPSFELKNPVRTGYTFAGWTGSNGTGPQTTVGVGQGSTGDLHFEANWTAHRYKIQYTGVEDVENLSALPTEHVFGTDTAIPNPIKMGYAFEGWKVNGGAAATRGLTLKGTAYTAEIALEATWQKLSEPSPEPEPSPVPDPSRLPQTGDNSPVLLWGAMLGVCAAGFALLKRKKR